MTTSHQVHIRETGETFVVAADEYVLDAALHQDIWYPRYCRNGVCGSCKTTLVRGTIDMDEYRVTALNEDEYHLHRFLACRARATSDCEIAFIPRDMVPRFSHPITKVPCTVRSIERPTNDIHIVRLRPADRALFVFTAGQYIDVSFGGLEPRGLSIASLPGERDIELHVRCVEGGEIGNHIRNHLQPGDTVIVEGPKGRAYLREVHNGAIIAVAGGIGLAPIKSIVDMALTAGLRQDIHIYLGFRDEGEVYLEEHFRMLEARAANVHVTVVLSEPSTRTSRRTGFVSEAIAEDLSLLKGPRAYLAGPPAMIDTTVPVLQRIGVRRKNCFADYLFESKKLPGAAAPGLRHG